MLYYLLGKHQIPSIVVGEAKRRKHIIYGTQAMNAQLPLAFRRRTQDWDIYARNPHATAHRMQARLDREIARGRDDFFSKPALHPGTHKVMHEGPDTRKGTRDDIGIIDYTKLPKTLETVALNGVKGESLTSIVRGKKKILRDPQSKYRWAKDRGDLGRIGLAQTLRGCLTDADKLLTTGIIAKRRRR